MRSDHGDDDDFELPADLDVASVEKAIQAELRNVVTAIPMRGG